MVKKLIQNKVKKDKPTLEKEMEQIVEAMKRNRIEKTEKEAELRDVSRQGEKERRKLDVKSINKEKVQQLKKQEEDLWVRIPDLETEYSALKTKRNKLKKEIQLWNDLETNMEKQNEESVSLPSENKKWKFGESRIAAPIKRD